MAKKIWITAAVTGAVHTPSLSPYLPITPEEIIEDAVKAYEAGAAVVHVHARDPKTGKPISDVKVMEKIVSGIKKRCNVIICVTTGGAIGMSLADRLAPIPALKPELASLNAGSINFVLSPMASTVQKNGAKHDWEIPYLEGTYDMIFPNTFYTFENYCTTMNEYQTRPELEVYDVAMINNIAYFLNKGVLKKPPYIQFVLGILGGLPATVEHLSYMVKYAKEQIGDFFWSCAAAGRYQFPLTATALAMGGNVRVGLEDNLYLGPGVLAKSSGEQVTRIKEIAERMGFESASPDEVRDEMGLKGKDNTGF